MSLSTSTVLPGLGVGLTAISGEVYKVKPHADLPSHARHQGDIPAEQHSLRSAIQAVGEHLEELMVGSDATTAEIFEALKMLLEDQELFETAVGQIESGWNAGTAFELAVETFGELLSGDAAFEERLNDLRDLAKRVHAHIHGIQLGLNLPATGNFILVAEDFSPADTAQFSDGVIGVITTKGGPTSHTAIICRSRSIPAVVSCPRAEELNSGDQVLVDPVGDRVVVGGQLSEATQAIQFIAKTSEPIIPVRANIGSLEDAVAAAASSANGVGLFRTELLYLSAHSQPTLESQVASYSEILSAAPEGPLVVRTIDAGSDKPVPFLSMPKEENPALGVRGFRLVENHREFVEAQLKALEAARVETGRDVWVMAPMIANLAEAKQFAELARANGKYQVGIMVETPSIAAILSDLAGVVDFISVGTNDLSQYLFAADRMNPQLGTLLNPWQPALIRTLAKIASDSEAAGISSGVCGESASDPAFAVVLAGLGFKSVSASRSQVAAVRSALSAVSPEQAKRIASLVLAESSAESAKAVALSELAKL